MPDDLGFAAYQEMGPTFLAEASVVEKIDVQKPWRDWSVCFTALESRLYSMRTWRYSWWTHWSMLAAYFLPRRYIWLVQANRQTRGSPINDAIIDSTGALAVNICASGLWTGLTSPSRPWFKLGVQTWEALDGEGQAWLEDTQKRVYAVLAGSNFYTTMAQAFQDVTVFGTAPVIMYEDDQTVLRCYLPCAGEYYLAVGGSLRVETLYREYTATVAQIVDFFGRKNCPEQVLNLWNTGGGSLEVEFVVCHAIEPNFPIAGRGADNEEVYIVPKSFAYKEVYWLRGMPTLAPLSKRGFHDKPFMAARWSQVSNDAYGRSPCMDALGDNRQVQIATRRKGEFVEKLVRPPMGADVAMKNEPSSILPGNITYYNTEAGRKGFHPLFEVQPAALQPLVDDIKGVDQRIERALFVDVFLAISRMEGVQPRNQLELTKRDLERLQILGPFIDLFENEFAGPAIERVLEIMKRRGLLKPMPKSLAAQSVKIEYTSIMKLAQQSARVVGMKDFLGTMGGLSSAAKAAGLPDPLRVVNLDKTSRAFADVTDFPLDLLFTDDEVAQHDQVRSQEMQKAKMEQQAPGAAMAAVNAAKTLSDTQMPDGQSGLAGLARLVGGGV